MVFSDDRWVTDLYGARRRLTEPFFLGGVDAALAEAIVAGNDFVHIVIIPAPDPSEVLQ